MLEPHGVFSAGSNSWRECEGVVHRLANNLRGQVFCLSQAGVWVFFAFGGGISLCLRRLVSLFLLVY